MALTDLARAGTARDAAATTADARPDAVRGGGVLVHEWIERTGGAERVLDHLVEEFPGAPVVCLWDDAPGRYPGTTVRESALARTPLRRHKALTAPLMPSVWHGRWSGVEDPEWVLATSHSFGHHFCTGPAARGARTLAYVHTPARFLWAPESDPRGRHPVVGLAAPALRHVDRRRARRLDDLAANSRYVRARIALSWGRDARVIYPPVDVAALTRVADWADEVTGAERAVVDSLPPTYVLGASRLVAYKRLDLVIRAGEAAGLPVLLVGEGPQAGRLAELAAAASVPVRFLGAVSDALLRLLMQRALAYVFPPVEDFGILPVEAMALGAPTVVNAEGGARESVERLGLGVVAESLDDAGLRRAVEAAAALPRADVSALAERTFGVRRFRREVRDWVDGG
ncbi:glycosyltransferase [Puerhibacterium puerhi]|uniref:glycosyltransferase n=1 Tax=Puerhibacterium puerhi TaxID=2692623 RepID=UPI00135CDB36|nr:glycosyltransferase [Puerhibacterium puerhi]